ncbi:hypothetical protein EON80_12465 [bacterium]|nr:MAG: hypothetical protein EON80_12465 [bacterium]
MRQIIPNTFTAKSLFLRSILPVSVSIASLSVFCPNLCAAPTVKPLALPISPFAKAPEWALGPFVRPAGVNPVISPNPYAVFDDPITKKPVRWEALHTFNPAAIVRDGKVYVLYRAEDDSGAMAIGQHISRVGMAVSDDGLRFSRLPAPVFFPAEDAQKDNEANGGCEDPRIVEGPDGTYVLTYTQWNRSRWRAGIATSKDLINWTKYGPAFAKAYNGKYANLGYKSCGIVTRQEKGRLIAAKINGKFWMYWGEDAVHLATSDDLVNWTPLEDADGKLLKLITPRQGKFDSALTEVGPPPVITDRGILLIYNGKNAGEKGDPNLGPSVYSGGQALFDINDPSKLLGRLDAPFFKPQLPFEMSGQYAGGTTFLEGMVNFKDKWFLYYGCADSLVGVTVLDRTGKIFPEVIQPVVTSVAANPWPRKHPLMPADISKADKFGAGTALQGVRRIVCLGDSITQGGDGPTGYVGMLRNYLSRVAPGQFRVINAGISGHKTTDLIERFDRDVLQNNPDLVTINIGVNDVWHGYFDGHTQGGGPRGVPLPQYRSNLGKMVKEAQAKGAVVVLVSPTGVYEDLDGSENARLETYIAAMRDVAQKNKCLFVDWRQPFETYIDLSQTTGNTEKLLTFDGVHVNDWGSRIMAATLVTALTSPAPKGVKLRKSTLLPKEIDLALHKTILVSSSESDEVGKDNVVDGVIGTRWASGRTDKEWITVDLGAPQRVDTVHLDWEVAFAKEYKIQVSDDGQNWREVANITDGRGGDATHSFRPTNARYVKVLGVKRGTQHGYSLWEINVFGPNVK